MLQFLVFVASSRMINDSQRQSRSGFIGMIILSPMAVIKDNKNKQNAQNNSVHYNSFHLLSIKTKAIDNSLLLKFWIL